VRLAAGAGGYATTVAETDESPQLTPLERLRRHLAEADRRPREMQKRLDELGRGIEAARQQARDHDLLTDDDAGG
jgi:hypothetical protein